MLSENQLEQICSDIDAMVLSGLSVDDLETFIKSEIENIKRNSPQKVFRYVIFGFHFECSSDSTCKIFSFKFFPDMLEKLLIYRIMMKSIKMVSYSR